MTRNSDDDWYWDSFDRTTIEVIEEAGNPHHQGFIGFVPLKDGDERHMRDAEIHKTARRIAAELILLPREHRGSAEYPEDYLKTVSQCRLWNRIRCAYCDCIKSQEDEK